MNIGLAFKAFFKVLGNKELAERIGAVLDPKPALEAAAPVKSDSAAQLLAALQREGRFVDFLNEDLSGFGDAQIGAVARDMHTGCRKVLDQYLEVEPVLKEGEGETVTVEEGFNAHNIRLVGKVEGDPPFKGTLRHHGWKLVESKLPALGEPGTLLPAEVEL